MSRQINLGINIKELIKSNDPSLDFIQIHIQEGTVEIDEHGVSLPCELVTNFNNGQLKALGLSPLLPYSLKCESSGVVARNSYKISYKFYNDRVPCFYKKIEGAIIYFEDVKFILPYYIYKTIGLIDEVNSSSSSEMRLLKLQELKEYLPHNSIGQDDDLFNIEIIVPEKFTLDIVDESTFTLAPTFLIEDNGDHLEHLFESENQKFHKDFCGFTEINNKFMVGRNKFIVLNEDMVKMLNVIKTSMKKDISERRSLYFNPVSYISEKAPEINIEKMEASFVKTDKYASDRVERLGIWVPKTQIFLPKEGSEWFPKDCIGIALGDSFAFVRPDEIDQICDKIQTAINKGETHVTHAGSKFSASEENLNKFKSAKLDFERVKKEINPEPKDVVKTKEDKLVPIIKDNIEDSIYISNVKKRNVQDIFIPSNINNVKFLPHQEEGIRWLQDSWNNSKRGVLLADDMGLGKTLQVLIFLAWIKELQKGKKLEKSPILIVGPTGLLKNWQDEHSKFLNGDGLGKLAIGHGSEFSMIKKLGPQKAARELEKHDWVLTTYETLSLQQDIFGAVKWCVAAFDECQSIKNPNSFKTEMAKAMAAEFSIGITGTPVENRLSDLWCITDTMSPGLLGIYKDFKDKYEKSSDHLEELKEKLTVNDPPPYMFRRLKLDHLKGLPEKKEVVVETEMPNIQVQAYEQVINKAKRKEYGKSPFLALQHLKAVSLTPNFEETDDDKFINSSANLIALFKILTEIKNRNEKTLIFVDSRALQQRLIPIIHRKFNLKEMPLLINGTMSGLARKAKVDTFQSMPTGFQVMILGPKSGGTGLTITAANNVIHLERWWNPAIEDQCSDRVYRIGQNKDVNIYIPIGVFPEKRIKTFDQVLHELLTKKRELSRSVIVPTEFNSEDHKEFLRQATGLEVETREKDSFYVSQAWRDLRYRVFQKYGSKCKMCGKTKNEASLEVDHIKPRSKYPELELDFDNLQILCSDCNQGKSNKYEDDLR